MATVQEIKDQVGDDPDKARAALEEEQAGEKRSTLIEHLEKVAGGEDGGSIDAPKAETEDGEGNVVESDAPVRGQLPTVEPTPPTTNPTTLGQQLEAGATRRGFSQGKVVGQGTKAATDGSNFDIRPAVVTNERGRLRKVKQINTLD